jgi:hypothetical protein
MIAHLHRDLRIGDQRACKDVEREAVRFVPASFFSPLPTMIWAVLKVLSENLLTGIREDHFCSPVWGPSLHRPLFPSSDT